MATAKLSRRKVASHLADELIAGKQVTNKLAAFLIESKRTRELELYVRDIEAALAERGVLLADVASAREIANETFETITNYLKKKTGAKDVHLRTTVDPALLGGVRIETPDERLDSTLRHKLNQLTASKL
jgi:F-type H+-transporting ATPase subunit delta